jgi:beta-glucuronidase
MLFPQQNNFRAVFDLGGYWNLKADPNEEGHKGGWYKNKLAGEVHSIAIPGSWNEQLAEQGLRNYVGKAWHETYFTIPAMVQESSKVWLRVAAADHKAEVWLNGHFVGVHSGGYVPFELDLSDALNEKGQKNHLVVCVDSSLSMHTIPQDVNPESPLYNSPSYERRHLFPATRFDFFPYGGLTRSVQLVTTPKAFISDIDISTTLEGQITVTADTEADLDFRVRILSADDQEVASGVSKDGVCELSVDKPEWWSPSNPYLYTASISLMKGRNVVDEYHETFGIREVRVEGGKIMFNNEPLFMSGFGKHEDFPIVGRGQFRPAYLKDHELMRWIGANSYRTSHYPYDEEMMRLADKLGFLIIDEVPAVSLGFWSNDFDELNPLLENHKKSIRELIERDKNHPSVISWSITNEPNLWAEEFYQNEASKKYFKELYDFTKNLDDSRPIMSISMAAHKENDVVLESCDIIGLNRYYGWYTNPVDLEKAGKDLARELDSTFEKYGKPIMVTEFGADTVEGLHATTAQMFTEEFQTAFIFKYLEVMEPREFVAGAHVWNFADFMTPQHFRRVVLNKKGVFTRDRHPKSVAFKLRDHWNSLERIQDDHRPKKPRSGFLISDVK